MWFVGRVGIGLVGSVVVVVLEMEMEIGFYVVVVLRTLVMKQHVIYLRN